MTERKWGVQLRHNAWMRHDDIPSDQIECARLFNSPQNAAAMAGTIGTVREVLVTQEAGGWELDSRVTHLSMEILDCVVATAGGSRYFAMDDLKYTSQQHLAVIHKRVDRAFAHAVEVVRRHGGRWGVFSIRRTEPREVRRAGRTLDEILASVPVEMENG